MYWKLERPEPALPNSFFWTWDHSTNWMLDDPGIINFGCMNKYLKRSGTFIEDYKRLIDFASGLGIKGITIWGFLRDSHGGEDAAKTVAEYAQSKGVSIMPGIGTTAYGGIYYEGNHRYNIETFLKKNPEVQLINEDGKPECGYACPCNPVFMEWLQEGIMWLFREFRIGGANMENGDFLVCHDKNCMEHKAFWPEDDPDFFRLQAISYKTALDCIRGELENKIVVYATYTGFMPGKPPTDDRIDNVPGSSAPYMHCSRPAMIDSLPASAIAQWTLSGMLRQKPIPLKTYLYDGVPAEVFDNNRWPEVLRPPAARNAGYHYSFDIWRNSYPDIHRNSSTRYDLTIGSIKEMCLRAYRAGLEGVSIIGEVSSVHIPAALNYLAFSHFIHWPEDALLEFGEKTLGQILGSASEGKTFVETLADWDSGTITDSQINDTYNMALQLENKVMKGEQLTRWRFWDWLAVLARGVKERYTASFF